MSNTFVVGLYEAKKHCGMELNLLNGNEILKDRRVYNKTKLKSVSLDKDNRCN